jgi:hypothetical protein
MTARLKLPVLLLSERLYFPAFVLTGSRLASSREQRDAALETME